MRHVAHIGVNSSPRIRKIVVEEAAKIRGPHHSEKFDDSLRMFEGVYGWFIGPTYETPSEVRGGLNNGMYIT